MSYQFGNAANWEPFFTRSVFALQATPTAFQPIPEITIPITLDSHVIALFVSSASAKDTWRFAGLLNQKIQTGIVTGGDFGAAPVARRKLYLNKVSVQIFPKLTDEYAISVDIPSWFKDVYVSVWKYIGPVPDESGSTCDLTEIQADLLRIEEKVNTILTLEGQ